MSKMLEDRVTYGTCRRCGWRANLFGVGMANECPECRARTLTIISGTIAEVAARLAERDQLREQGKSVL